MAKNNLDDMNSLPPLPELPPLEDVLKLIKVPKKDERESRKEDKYQREITALKNDIAKLRKQIKDYEKPKEEGHEKELDSIQDIQISSSELECTILESHTGNGRIQIVNPSGKVVCHYLSGIGLCRWQNKGCQYSKEGYRYD